jgi:xylulokinase
MSVILAFDFGGTNTRAALLDQTGQVIAEHAAPQDIPGGPAVTEVDPAHWWRLFCQSVEALAENHAFEAVRGLALTGMTRTQVFLDAAGEVIRPALTFRDSRAVEDAARLAALAPEDWAERGQLNAFHPAARLAWLASQEPQYMARLHTVLDPKDYLNFKLTGRAATDSISAARLRAVLEGPEAVRAALGLPASATAAPSLVPTEVLGPVLAGLPGALSRLAGCPVFVMTHDTWAAVAGLGALQPGLAYNISGTTEVTGVIGTEPVEAPGLPLVDWGPGLQQIGGPSQSGADSVPALPARRACALLESTFAGGMAGAEPAARAGRPGLGGAGGRGLPQPDGAGAGGSRVGQPCPRDTLRRGRCRFRHLVPGQGGCHWAARRGRPGGAARPAGLRRSGLDGAGGFRRPAASGAGAVPSGAAA